MFDYELKIAQDKKEIQGALRLRYEVFRREMMGGLKNYDSEGLDEDAYDRVCDHLIVIDKETSKIIGTYRILQGCRREKGLGFYSEKFFDIRNIKKAAAGFEVLELGRSCIHKDYRNRSIINLLWTGIAKYIKDNNVRFLFGPVRLQGNDPQEISKTFKFMQERFYSGDELRVYPWEKNKLTGLDYNVKVEEPRKIFNRLPPLVKGYVRLGILVCGEPALNSDLNSVVVFALLDIKNIPAAYRNHFIGDVYP